ncbi:MAG: hypothetical protein RLZZ68_1176 [Bacteroidota bacterium]|jgi:hypothetical protein|nr:T9SS C-terminal target domain-containing protein [Flavobacteriia bacterium]
MKNLKFPLIVVLASTFCAFILKNPERTHYLVSPKNSGGAAPGKTGAPGETNCTQCHSGSAVQDGAAENILVISQGGVPVNSYAPGQQYTVNLSMASNPVKRGFQATALNSSNTMAGGFTGLAGNTSISGSSKKYANHTSSSNTSASAPNWTWTWTAPNAGTGDVTFYVATNKTNNNGNDNGDMIYLSQFMIQEASNAGIEENASSNISLLGISADAITFQGTKEVDRIKGISIHDASGKLLFFIPEIMGVNNQYVVPRPSEMQKGLYFVTFQLNQKLISKKISIAF